MASARPLPHTDLLGAVNQGPAGSESLVTVVVAFGANLLIAVAKSVAATVTGSASMLAEAAHSWADTGNEIFLIIANRRAAGRPTRAPARLRPGGLRVVAVRGARPVRGRCRRVDHARRPGADHPEPASDFLVGYVVFAVSFVLEGISFLQGARQAKREAASLDRDLIEHVMATSDPTCGRCSPRTRRPSSAW